MIFFYGIIGQLNINKLNHMSLKIRLIFTMINNNKIVILTASNFPFGGAGQVLVDKCH